MNNLNKPNTPVQQFTTVYHAEYGKGKVVSLTLRQKDQLVMCYFPKANQHDWVLLSALETGTDEVMSLTPIQADTRRDTVSDPLQQALNDLFGGGR